MEIFHQRNLMGAEVPFNLFFTDVAEFPPHWHEEIEIVYVLDENLVIGLNNEIFTVKPRDIFLIGRGEVHFFITPPKKSKRFILQFELSMFEAFAASMRERKFTVPLVDSQGEDTETHRDLERQILAIEEEYGRRDVGYQLAIKARLYDFIVILLRRIPMEKYSSLEQNKHLKRLERLAQVFEYVERNHTREITLEEIAKAANFSIYHFTRFFKEATGLTFIQYLNNYRVTKAMKYLINSSDEPITEVAFRSGFESIKTFNRVFRQIKGCSPSSYKKTMTSK